MRLDRRIAVAALAAGGLLWGTTVPMTKLALEWLPPGWLTVARFGLAAAVLLAAGRSRVRDACSPAVLAWGAVGYGGSILVQNAGITRTSVSHAALLIGATPVLVAVIAALRHRQVARPVAWTGFAVSFAGVGLVAAGGGGGATFTGDGLVLGSLVFSASFTVAQARLLRGRDPVAVTAVQFLAAALATLPVAAVTEGTPPAPGGAAAWLATAGLAVVGTLAPSTLFAYGQARVSAEVAGAFVNLEPLVGAAAGAVVFGDPVGIAQAAGGAAILTGIALSSLPLLAGHPGTARPPPMTAGDGANAWWQAGASCHAAAVPTNYFDERIAKSYEARWPELFEPAVLDPAVRFLAELAGTGAALELGIGTGRVAIPLSRRGVRVHGIELSPDMAAELRAKPGTDDIGVTIGDFATTRVGGTFRLAYLVRNTIMNLTTQDEQVACFGNVAAQLEPGGCFVIEVIVPQLQRLPPGETVRAFTVTPTHLGFEEYEVATQIAFSHHYWVVDGQLETFSTPFRYVWPSELDLMARLAGMTLRERWSDWTRAPFTSDSRSHVSVWEKPA